MGSHFRYGEIAVSIVTWSDVLLATTYQSHKP